MAADDDDKDPRVRDLLGKPLEQVVDEVTAAALARWFSLPSFTQVEEGEVELAAEDPEVAAVRERRQQLLEHVDPALLEAHRVRVESAWELIKFEASIDVRLDPDLCLFDHDMAASRALIAEPRELERPEDISDEMQSNAPQALLRDLHRPEMYFDKTFEVVDVAASQRLDAVAAVREAFATSWKLPPLGRLPSEELATLFDDIRAERRAPWSEIPRRAKLVNRRIDDDAPTGSGGRR